MITCLLGRALRPLNLPSHSRPAAETPHGNILKGWDSYVSASDIKIPNTSRKTKIPDNVRLFTGSSVAFMPDAELMLEGDEEADYPDDMAFKRKRFGY